jgi:hypothetical protein
VADTTHHLSHAQFIALLAGDQKLRDRLAAGERMRVISPFNYPGRQGPVVVYLGPRPETDSEEPRSAPAEDYYGDELGADEEFLVAIGAGRRGKTAASSAPLMPPPPPPGSIRISDGGQVVKSLAAQGMELEVDMIMSKTVFHAVRQQLGAGLKGSEVYIDTSADTVHLDLWRFLQLVAEVIGLRHGKYKDALIQLEKRKDADAGILGWRPT